MEARRLLEVQNENIDRFVRLCTNISKDSKKRKTSQYVCEKRKQVEELFAAIKSAHEQLEDEPWYTNAVKFQAAQKSYNGIIDHLEEFTDCDSDASQQGCSSQVFKQSGRSNKMNKYRYQIAALRNKLQRTKEEFQDESLGAFHYQTSHTAISNMWRDIDLEFMSLIENDELQPEHYDEMQLLRADTESVVYKLCKKIDDSSVSTNKVTPSDSTINLPKLSIPYFSGNYELWPAFCDLFTQLIHNNKKLTNVEKMQYLKSYVKGEAIKIISHLNVCDAHYDTAWTLLLDRYQNERILIYRHIDNILNVRRVERADAASLKTLHDVIKESLRALESLGLNVSTWDPWLTRIICVKWDYETNEKFEQYVMQPKKIPKLQDMLSFLEKRFMCLEASGSGTSNKEFMPRKQFSHVPQIKQQSVETVICWYCKSRGHDIYRCGQFKALTALERNKEANVRKLCKVCLTHEKSEGCKSSKSCGICGKYGHHTLVHCGQQIQPKPANSRPLVSKNYESGSKKLTSNVVTSLSSEVALLATALVRVQSKDGIWYTLRALCDPGSEAAFCTEDVAQKLAFPRAKIKAEVSGIGGGGVRTSRYAVQFGLEPRLPDGFKLPVEFMVLPKITSPLPSTDVPQLKSECLESKLLADDVYYKRGDIDIMLGAKECARIQQGQIEEVQDGVITQRTRFGWIIYGACSTNIPVKQVKVLSYTTRAEEVQQLQRFWELEEVTNESPMSTEDRLCEEYYKRTTTRGSDGTYTVRLPLRRSEIEYGESRRKAVARLLSLEKKLDKDVQLRARYQEFLNEYLKMGHMKKVTGSERYQGKYYIPHQPVINENSLTTKLRVVFDASSKASRTDCSLNDNMYKGPRLQQELATILLRWRRHRIVFMADIEKMYRFIKVHEKDYDYQRILWRESPKHHIDEYVLTTVTYGTASAPYLAVKTLQQLAVDEMANHPVASKVALRDFYVDDILSGHDTLEQARELQLELIKMLKKGGFNLRKWSSNSVELLECIPEENKDDTMMKIPLDETRKSLGVIWSPSDDTFRFQVTVNRSDKPTKRYLLSEVAKLFDPLGWLAPIVINMKLMIQELWTNGSEWDQPVDESIKRRWLEIQDQLQSIEKISIPRWCNFTSTQRVELHGFCDASEKAYGAVVYCKTQVDMRYRVTLLQAKSKVAPKKHKVTLPRLELCAAVLLVQLMDRVIEAMGFTNLEVFCWTDSMIALGWIRGEAERWKTFVANRVSEIQKLLPKAQWNHVVSAQNPADIISRGVSPSSLENISLWWNGPQWLVQNNIPVTKSIPEVSEELKKISLVTVNLEPQSNAWERFSSFQRMIRVLAYCRRMKNKQYRGQPLSCEEIMSTASCILKQAQLNAFEDEYKLLLKGRQLSKSSRLASLDPFIDAEGLIRVGGRLQNSELPYNQKHPIVLPYKHRISLMIIQDAHLKMLHGNNNQTLAYIRQKYWILGGKKMIKKQINECVRCIRYKATSLSQKMGNLPKPRVTQSFPFSHTGVDYAGPIQVRAAKGRGNRSFKGYIAVFVCLSVKAVHLELVGDLSTESFLAALRRFVARRGPVSHLYSDNGTNFVGAANLINREVSKIIKEDIARNAVTNMGIKWHFTPPSSPHFGGIWEAGVKSMKYHLRRVIGEQTLTYEELTTLLQQIEACMNSRPLCAVSEELSGEVVLTPSHFLTGREAVKVPDPLENIEMSLSSRWKQVQKMRREYWKSWSRDYLHQLQQRYKWKTSKDNIKTGSIVLVKDDNQSPSQWPLAEIIEVHKGKDNLARVVSLRKAGGTIVKRSVHTLIPLPVREEVADRNQIVQTTNANVTRITHNHPEASSKRKKATRFQHISQLLFSCLLLLQMFGTGLASYTMKEVPPGLYVEQVGTAGIDRGVFRIETCFERSRLEQDMTGISKVTQRFQELCNRVEGLTEEMNCREFHHHLQEHEQRFSKTKEFLVSGSHNRKKRGLLGQLLTSVFGVNDEVYRDINSLNENQEKLIEAANHQTKFMVSALAHLNDTEIRVLSKLNKFNTKLNLIINYLNEKDHWYAKVDINKANIYIMQTYLLAINYIEEIMSHYSGLLEIYLAKATLYSILSPSNVTDIIKAANQKLPSNLRIVQKLLMDTKLKENSTHIQVYGYFPIEEIAKYTLVYVTPVPKKTNNNTFVNIDVSRPYVGVDYNNELYFDLNQDEFKNCLRISIHFICFPIAVKNMQLHDNNCIVNQIFTNKTQKECLTTSFHMTNHIVWKQLFIKNTWLFIVRDQITASVICDGQREEFILQNVGVLQIAENCIIKTATHILNAQRLVTTEIVASFIKPVDFVVYNSSYIGRSFNITEDTVVDMSSDKFHSLLGKEIMLQQTLHNTVWKQITDHTYVTSFISSVVSIIVIAFLYFLGLKGYRKLKRRRSTTSPQEQLPAVKEDAVPRETSPGRQSTSAENTRSSVTVKHPQKKKRKPLDIEYELQVLRGVPDESQHQPSPAHLPRRQDV